MFEAEIARIQNAIELRFDEVDQSIATVEREISNGFKRTRKPIKKLRQSVAGGLVELGIALTAQMADVESRLQNEIDKVNRRIDDLGRAS